MKCGGSKPTTYIHGIKLISMNKKEIKNAINKAAYELAESMGYEVHDDEGDGTVLFVPVDYTTIDDTITWHRSHHDTCVLNWSSDKIKADAEAIDTHMKTVIEFYNDLYTEPQYSQSKPRIFTLHN